MAEKKDNKLVQLIGSADKCLAAIPTVGEHTLLMAQARKDLLEAYKIAKTVVLIEEPEDFKSPEGG